MSATPELSTPDLTTADSLRAQVADLIGVDPAEIDGDANLVFLGLGSLEMMRLSTKWRRAGLRVVLAELAAVPTIDAWAAYLAAPPRVR
ncbi:phosphopantetheine-binding protein [Actinokineospora pegani]|uniref:phosphopantetheine-binding protein n=1 Tax=Actinokineospora pegani TaxID=2654637 RepID=UPI0012EA61BD|nr:phosphopantetheine-binding protein [Actinokineospora pegani]